MKTVFIVTPPVVRGADLKSYRQECLHMTVDAFAERFGTSRQHVARLERLERPLTSREVMSIDLTKPARDGRTLLKLVSTIGAR